MANAHDFRVVVELLLQNVMKIMGLQESRFETRDCGEVRAGVDCNGRTQQHQRL